MKTVKVVWNLWDPEGGDEIDISDRLTGRWKIKQINDHDPLICVEIRERGLLSYFRKPFWSSEDCIDIKIIEETMFDCKERR